MRGVARALGCLFVAGCAGIAPAPPPAPDFALDAWRAPAEPTDAARLRIVPARAVVTLGSHVALRVLGTEAGSARCLVDGRAASGSTLTLTAERESAIEVACGSDAASAFAQVTFTSALRLPLADPYAGGVILLRARRSPRPLGPEGARAVGLPALDARLAALDLAALSAFPLDRSWMRDRSLSHWLAIDVPEEVNFYQAAALLRASEDVYAESYLPLAGAGLRVDENDAEVAPLVAVRPDRVHGFEEPELLSGEDPAEHAALPADLRAMSVARAWRRAAGEGATIAIVDGALDVEDPALAPNLVAKPSEYPGVDADGNGVPGDEHGASFAGLVVATGAGAPRLALASETSAPSKRATVVALAAAGAGEAPARLGVAPRARILGVEVHGDPAQAASPWSKALGIVYAVTEGAGVLTCAWDGDEPHWLVHDALLFAEQHCVVALCASSAGTSPQRDYPRAWTPAAREASGAESDAALDAWTGETLASFLPRPLRGPLLVRSLDARGVVADVAVTHDVIAAVGRAAGAVAVVRGLRPDLEPMQIREVLRAALDGEGLDLAAALDRAEALPEAGCVAPEQRRSRTREAAVPWWKQVRVRVSTPEGGIDPLPRDSEDATDPRKR